jgi:hypothetical protein
MWIGVVLAGLAMIGASYRLFVLVFYDGNYQEGLAMSAAVVILGVGGMIIIILGLILKEATASRLYLQSMREHIKGDASSAPE